MSIELNPPNIKKHLVLDDISHVLNGGRLSGGRYVTKMEKLVKETIGSKYAISIANGTLGLEGVLECINIDGMDVITSPFTFRSAVYAILRAGGQPVFADVLSDGSIDFQHVQQLTTARTAAVIGTHIFGSPCDAISLQNWCCDHNIDFIEDGAQAYGATCESRRVGSIGGAGVFSFYNSKNLSAGEGGVVTTNDHFLAERLGQWKNNGFVALTSSGNIGIWGRNARMADINAAVLTHQLCGVKQISDLRKRNAAILSEYVEPINKKLGSVWHLFTIMPPVPRDLIRKCLGEKGIGSGVYYDYLCNYDHRFPVNTPTPKALEIAQNCLSLPVHHGLGEDQMRYIGESYVGIIDQYGTRSSL